MGRTMQLRDGKRRIQPSLQSKMTRASAPAGRRIVVSGARKVSHPIGPFETTTYGIERPFIEFSDGSRPVQSATVVRDASYSAFCGALSVSDPMTSFREYLLRRRFSPIHRYFGGVGREALA